MGRDRDVAAFSERAQTYESGWRGRMHHDITHRAADLALTRAPALRRVLDVGCGTGYLLRVLADRVPGCAGYRPPTSPDVASAASVQVVVRRSAASDAVRDDRPGQQRSAAYNGSLIPSLIHPRTPTSIGVYGSSLSRQRDSVADPER